MDGAYFSLSLPEFSPFASPFCIVICKAFMCSNIMLRHLGWYWSYISLPKEYNFKGCSREIDWPVSQQPPSQSGHKYHNSDRVNFAHLNELTTGGGGEGGAVRLRCKQNAPPDGGNAIQTFQSSANRFNCLKDAPAHFFAFFISHQG